MLSLEENDRLTRTNRGTPMGDLVRRFWVPALLSSDLPDPDSEPLRVTLLGERLVAFRDTSGRVGLLAPTSSSAATRRTGCVAPTTAGSMTSRASA